MAKKKLLNEATVRRFMGLAGMESNLVSNAISEMYNYNEEEEDMADEEMPPAEPEMAAVEPMDAAPEEPDMGDEMDAEMGEEGELNIDEDAIKMAVKAYEDLGEVVDMLSSALPDGEMDMGDEMDAEMPAEEPAMDAEEPAMDDKEEGMLEGVNLELSEDEVVQEVARRVAKRILQAKKAKAQLDEALGRKSSLK